MKKIFESKPQGFDEDAYMVAVYEVEDEKEQKMLYDIDTEDDACLRHKMYSDLFGFYDTPRGVMPGARYERYGYMFTGGQVVVTCHISYNV